MIDARIRLFPHPHYRFGSIKHALAAAAGVSVTPSLQPPSKAAAAMYTQSLFWAIGACVATRLMLSGSKAKGSVAVADADGMGKGGWAPGMCDEMRM